MPSPGMMGLGCMQEKELSLGSFTHEMELEI